MSISNEAAEARAANLRRYKSRYTCRHGHAYPWRYSLSGRCVRCHSIALKNARRTSDAPVIDKRAGAAPIQLRVSAWTPEQADLILAYAAMIALPPSALDPQP